MACGVRPPRQCALSCAQRQATAVVAAQRSASSVSTPMIGGCTQVVQLVGVLSPLDAEWCWQGQRVIGSSGIPCRAIA